MSRNTTDELREAVRDGLANHTGEFANPWIFKGSYSHELLADILNDIMASERLFKNLESLISNREKLLLDRVEKELDESYRKSGQGSRPQFSKDTETRGESYSRTQGFKSAILVAKRHLATLRKELDGDVL